MSIFHDQAKFMEAAGTPMETDNEDVILMTGNLIAEEFEEWRDEPTSNYERQGLNHNEIKETLDLIYTAAQYLNVLIGADKAKKCWDALQANNMSKCVDGKLVKRADGKVLKPEGYKPLDLTEILDS